MAAITRLSGSSESSAMRKGRKYEKSSLPLRIAPIQTKAKKSPIGKRRASVNLTKALRPYNVTITASAALISACTARGVNPRSVAET
jgi:hypothetical protein